MTRVAINGFGRIGRTFFRMAFLHPDFEIVAINDLGDLENLAYLLRYDTAYGRSDFEVEVKDSLLPIVLDNEKCDDCQIQDPYTCIASVIIPHWQGRFDNMDFRRFFERQLRMEAPAHVFLIICWISCEQMTEFEQKYKAWLIENARKEKDYGMLSARLYDLIDVLGRLRNVYPSGTLYDCEQDETLENAIILNNSVLGND